MEMAAAPSKRRVGCVRASSRDLAKFWLQCDYISRSQTVRNTDGNGVHCDWHDHNHDNH